MAITAERATVSDNPTLDAALKYAEYGWSVFPCKRDKTPLTAHGLKDAVRDRSQIEAWWARWPDAGIGINCGTSNIVVVDYDPHNDPDKAGYQILTDLLGATETRQAKSGSGGRHYYFRASFAQPIRNSAMVIGPGIDVRGDGGYIVAPPSMNEKGPYEWVNTGRLEGVPESVLRLTAEKPKPRAAAQPPRVEQPIPEGQRNATLASLAGFFRQKGMGPLTLKQALLAANQERCEPPLPDDEVEAIADSISRYPAGELPIPQGAHDTEPSVEVLDVDAARVSVTLADRVRAFFTFTEMEKDRRELSCHLSISFFESGEPFEQRINLESSTQRNELRRELDNLYGKDKGWARALNTVWSKARTAYLSQDRSMSVAEIPLLIGKRDLIPPLMPSEGITILFGDGSSSKSYICLGLALASAGGIPLAGKYTAPPANVMYVDYEDSAGNFRRRTNRILQPLGLTVDDVPNLRHWKARGIPIKDQWDAIKRACDFWNISWIVVDSAGTACGGAPEEAISALGFFSSVERIGRPCLAIAHINRSGTKEATQRPFGTVYWSNTARRTWFVTRADEEGSDVIRTALYCRKVNDGQKPRPLGFRISFEGEEGPVRFEPIDPSDEYELAKHGNVAGQIWAVLDEPRTLAEIEEFTGILSNTARITMTRHKEKFIQIERKEGGHGGRPVSVWARVRQAQEKAECPF